MCSQETDILKERFFHTSPSLKARYHEILSYAGIVLCGGGFFFLSPLLALPFFPEEYIYSVGFIAPAAILLAGGYLLWRSFRSRRPIALTINEGGIIVLISWITICLFSAFPFLIIQKLPLTHAVFESVSGWTTTGLSVLEVSKAPHLVLLWRSIMQWAGGAGLAIIMLAAIAGPLGPGLSVAEGRSEQLAPHVRTSAKIVMILYSGYTLAGFLGYFLAGMSPFDAVNHVFAAVSTGGFSTHPESIAYWNSGAVELISCILMILGNLNFLIAYLIVKEKLKAASRNGELRLLAFLIPTCILFLYPMCKNLYPSLGKSIRVAVFETISALTTTGFTTTTYTNWNSLGYLILTVLMIIGGGTCSTAGGLKQYRVYVLFKSLVWDIKRSFLPRTAVVENFVWQGERKDYISDSRIRKIATFVFFYFLTYVIGTGVLTAYGYGLKESLFEYASALSTVGLSVGITAANAPPLVLWIETLGMFLGRLEFFVIFISLGRLIRDAIVLAKR